MILLFSIWQSANKYVDQTEDIMLNNKTWKYFNYLLSLDLKKLVKELEELYRNKRGVGGRVGFLENAAGVRGLVIPVAGVSSVADWPIGEWCTLDALGRREGEELPDGDNPGDLGGFRIEGLELVFSLLLNIEKPEIKTRKTGAHDPQQGYFAVGEKKGA